jgi:transposase
MFALTNQNIFYLYRNATDMRMGFDSLCGIVQNELNRNPASGDVFIFINKPRNRIKLLHWERGGYLLYYKRLETGTFDLPEFDSRTKDFCIAWHQLVMLIEGISFKNLKMKKRMGLSTIHEQMNVSKMQV